MEKYDPMTDFYKKAIDFLFKQTPAIAMCMVAVFVMWQKSEALQIQNKEDINRINAEWSRALNIANVDWRMCEQKRQELEIKFAKLSVRFEKLERRGK